MEVKRVQEYRNSKKDNTVEKSEKEIEKEKLHKEKEVKRVQEYRNSKKK